VRWWSTVGVPSSSRSQRAQGRALHSSISLLPDNLPRHCTNPRYLKFGEHEALRTRYLWCTGQRRASCKNHQLRCPVCKTFCIHSPHCV
jgi:hypothetical protein